MGRSHANYYRHISLSRAIISICGMNMFLHMKEHIRTNEQKIMASSCDIFAVGQKLFFQLFYSNILILIYIQVGSEKFTPNQS